MTYGAALPYDERSVHGGRRERWDVMIYKVRVEFGDSFGPEYWVVDAESPVAACVRAAFLQEAWMVEFPPSVPRRVVDAEIL